MHGEWTVTPQPDGSVHISIETFLGSVNWDTDATTAEELGKLLVRKAQRARQLAAENG